MIDPRRHPSGSLSARKTEAWALAIGLGVPLAHPCDSGGRSRRGSLPDVLPEPDPRRPQRAGAFATLAAMALRLFGRAEAAPAGAAVVATLRQPEPAPAAPDTAAGGQDTTHLAA